MRNNYSIPEPGFIELSSSRRHSVVFMLHEARVPKKGRVVHESIENYEKEITNNQSPLRGRWEGRNDRGKRRLIRSNGVGIVV